MRSHIFEPNPDSQKVVCSRCGLRVRYVRGCRSSAMDWAIVQMAERTVILSSGFKIQAGRLFGDCDRMMEVAVRVVMRD